MRIRNKARMLHAIKKKGTGATQPWQTASPISTSPLLQFEPHRRAQFRPVADYLAMGWRRYGIARNHFVQRIDHGHYAYERRTEWRVCALVAIYIGLTGSHPKEVYGMEWDAVEFGITGQLGFNLRHVYAPAITSALGVSKGEPTSLFSHLALLTDNHWPKQEIINYCRTAEAWHWQSQER